MCNMGIHACAGRAIWRIMHATPFGRWLLTPAIHGVAMAISKTARLLVAVFLKVDRLGVGSDGEALGVVMHATMCMKGVHVCGAGHLVHHLQLACCALWTLFACWIFMQAMLHGGRCAGGCRCNWRRHRIILEEAPATPWPAASTRQRDRAHAGGAAP